MREYSKHPLPLLADGDALAADLAAALRPFVDLAERLEFTEFECLTFSRPGRYVKIDGARFLLARVALARFDRAAETGA